MLTHRNSLTISTSMLNQIAKMTTNHIQHWANIFTTALSSAQLMKEILSLRLSRLELRIMCYWSCWFCLPMGYTSSLVILSILLLLAMWLGWLIVRPGLGFLILLEIRRHIRENLNHYGSGSSRWSYTWDLFLCYQG